MRKGIEQKIIKEEGVEKDGYVETPRTKAPKVITKDRCKTPDSPEGARQANTPHSPSQSSPPTRDTSSPINNGNPNSLTPPPLPASAVLSVSLETPRPLSDQQFIGFGGYPNRQVSKLKKFLSTLVQFGNDINQDVGEKVKTLVLNLVSSNLSIVDFHNSLQDVTNFPLRPFVLPFLKSHLPILQREILTMARITKQSVLQYVRNNDHVILESTHSPSEASDIFFPTDSMPIAGLKRRSSDGVYENGINGQHGGIDQQDSTPHSKRHIGTNAQNNPFWFSHQQNFFLPNMNVTSSHLFDYNPQNNQSGVKLEDNGTSKGDEEWKNIHVMLNCILSMVEKTKRALAILQQRNAAHQDPTSDWLRKQDVSVDLKKAANEILSQAIRQTEERVADVRKRAEDAVNEVKRQAVAELQKAVAAAEVKAGELLAAERIKMEKLLVEARKHSEDPATTNHSEFGESNQSPSSQPAPSQQNSCWNCGRKAHDTCSGCSLARYCGPFCQHKDWENHHQICSKEKRQSLAPSVSPVVGTAAIVTQQTDSRTKK
ncbi:protein CBFA2T1 [Cylas formicarius]|uniref:protein CBFA2T1 n=1 Tax=Cylas formicarius TaxID=197179 RepID=UPI0029589F51|nr:protein CBFA2T1 [Cylas formicarius]